MIFRISRIQFIFVMWWLVMATGILTMPLAIANFTSHDGWISALLFVVGVVVSASIIKMFYIHFPSQTLSEALIESLGPWLGRTLNLWFFVWLCIQTALMARQFLLFAEITILPSTPLPVIAGVFFAPIAYSVFLGLELIARFAEFVTPIMIVVSMAVLIVIIPMTHFDLLLPVLGDGWSPVLKAAIQPTVSFAFQLIVSLEILPHLQHPEKAARDALITGALITLFLTGIEVVIISILGLTAHYLQYPILEVLRGIRIGRFIQRFDTLYVLGIIAVIFIKVAFYQFCFTSSLKTFVGFSSMRILTMATIAVTGAGSIFFWRDSVELSHYIIFVSPAYFAITLITLPLLAVIAKRLRNRDKYNVRVKGG